jgi:hypothetical protein
MHSLPLSLSITTARARARPPRASRGAAPLEAVLAVPGPPRQRYRHARVWAWGPWGLLWGAGWHGRLGVVVVVATVLHARRPLVPGPIVVCGRSCTGCVAFAERVSVALSVRAVATGAGAAGAEEADTEMGTRAAERGGGRSRPAVGRLLPLRAVSSLYACCSQAASSACNAAPYYSSNNASHLPRQREKFLNSTPRHQKRESKQENNKSHLSSEMSHFSGPARDAKSAKSAMRGVR